MRVQQLLFFEMLLILPFPVVYVLITWMRYDNKYDMRDCQWRIIRKCCTHFSFQTDMQLSFLYPTDCLSSLWLTEIFLLILVQRLKINEFIFVFERP